MIGKTLAHYEIIALLGRGGMGEVYRARDSKLGREVALKVLPPDLADDAERQQRFEREARAIAALKHPNIITLHSIEEADGVHFITMEYVEGDTLSSEIVAGGMRLERFFEVAIPIADALSSAHAKGIAHRDLKPSNIIRDADGRLKVLDFGLAKLFAVDPNADETLAAVSDNVTADGRIVGTVSYMSPEQAEGRSVDARSDVFSLGIVLYEMATGTRPFQGDTNLSTLSAILRDEPLSLTNARPALPRHLGRIIARCLAKDPARRYQSALDVRNELEALRAEIARGELDVPAQKVREQPTARAASPRPGRPAQVLGAIVGTTIVILVLLWFNQRRSDDPSPVQAPIRSLAVLPFASLSPEDDGDYFAAGMTDVLTTELARLSALKVIARNSAARFRDSELAPAEIASELGVEALVSGSVLRDRERVRISAQLADAGTDRVIWAESYERATRDVLSLQRDVARAVVGAIALQLSPDEERRLTEKSVVDPRALDEYLHGRALWGQRTEQGARQALEHFRAAVNIAPDFAPAYAGIADAYIVLSGYNWEKPHDVVPVAFAAIDRALDLDPSAAEPYASRGDLAYHFEHDFERAARNLDRAIELSPGYATAYYWRAEVSMAERRLDEALRLLEKATELDPLQPFARLLLARAQEQLGQAEEAERGYRQIVELSPEYTAAWGSLVRLKIKQNRLDDALADAHRAVELNSNAANLSTLGVALAFAGETGKAREVLSRLHDRAREEWVSPYTLAKVQAALGDRADALANLAAAIEARDFSVPALKGIVDVEFETMADDPELRALMDALGRPQDRN